MNKISIVIPTQNEAKNIEMLIKRIDSSLRPQKIAYEMIFVDDHSTDGTREKISSFSSKYPITLHIKKGKPGKAYSILEGAELSASEYIIMIDADLQYPPEFIPHMIKIADQHGVVVANRKVYKSSFIRRFASRFNKYVFGRLLLGLNCDVQSGLKLFRREIIEHLDRSNVSAWALDIPLIYTAVELGYSIGSVDITFERRKNGQSKINFLQTAFGIVWGALKLRTQPKRIYRIKPQKEDSMIGAGIVHQRQRFMTHTTLHQDNSALVTVKIWQLFAIFFLLGITIGGIFVNPYKTAIIVVAILSTIYFLDVLFSLYLLLRSLHFPPEVQTKDADLKNLKESQLPVYSILSPLYKEAHIVPQFLSALDKLDWPKNKLDVLLLLEEDDQETIAAVKQIDLPKYVRLVIVPHSVPKTKPKACNYGLALAKGDYIVIYDAEDIPDPKQLKIAYLAFAKLPKEVVCLQAKLNYYNPHHNLLTRLFTAEYSLWFDVILPGLQSIDTTIPLGGTSNHFRTRDLVKLEGWDPFNVTEDCDLGVRLFKEGYRTAIIDSTTLEEANSNFFNWLRQRSRWIKGYLQTYFVHMRQPIRFIRTNGLHAFIFQLVVGGKIAFMLINPLLWLATISYFTLYAIVGPTIESVYPRAVFYMALTSLVFGNFMYLYNYMIGCAKKEHWSLIKYVFFVPFYWLMVSWSAVLATIQLIVKPYYWEKTHHGFHILREDAAKAKLLKELKARDERQERIKRLKQFALSDLAGGGLLVFTSFLGNFFNFLYNTYLGRNLKVEEFGLVSLISSILYLSSIPLGAFTKTITYRSAYLFGKYDGLIKDYWVYMRKQSLKVSLIVAGLWTISIPLLAQFFHAESLIPFILFTPVWLIGFMSSVDSGFLTGNLKFAILALSMIVESLSKLGLSWVFVTLRLTPWVYAAVPASITLAFLVDWWIITLLKSKPIKIETSVLTHFPKRFFTTSIMTKLSGVAFLSFDIILAKHFLTPIEAGQYAYLSLSGKMIYYTGTLFAQFTGPLVSRAEGAGKNSKKIFHKFLFLTIAASLIGFLVVGIFGNITVPLLFGQKTQPILSLLPFYALAMAYFTISTTIVTYHQNRGDFLFPIVSFALTIVQLVGIAFYHQHLEEVTAVMQTTGVSYLLVIALLHLYYQPLKRLFTQSKGFATASTAVLKQLESKAYPSKGMKILIFNWRDTKHVWAGGAETYIHELSKQWIKDGHKVTVFCGNDQHNPQNEVIDRVKIIRRGGFYTVYLWAFLYYIFVFRGKYDLVIDSENGIPFFTPFYVGKPKFLLIHHVHQDVFREHLMFPFSFVAGFIESKLMPMAYRGTKIITVSESSKSEIMKLNITPEGNIHVVSPGIDNKYFVKLPKTVNPTFLYLGRLKPYKNIDIAIQAFSQVLGQYKDARLTIAGEGESLESLQKLVSALHIGYAVTFMGKVPEEEKVRLLARSWAALQPSSFEGWGITVIEANATGTPVIASNVNGLKDSVVNGKTGILVPPKRVSAFTQTMEELITRQKYRETLSKQALTWSRNFCWEDSAKNFYQIIEHNGFAKKTNTPLGKLSVITAK